MEVVYLSHKEYTQKKKELKLFAVAFSLLFISVLLNGRGCGFNDSGEWVESPTVIELVLK